MAAGAVAQLVAQPATAGAVDRLVEVELVAAGAVGAVGAIAELVPVQLVGAHLERSR